MVGVTGARTGTTLLRVCDRVCSANGWHTGTGYSLGVSSLEDLGARRCGPADCPHSTPQRRPCATAPARSGRQCLITHVAALTAREAFNVHTRALSSNRNAAPPTTHARFSARRTRAAWISPQVNVRRSFVSRATPPVVSSPDVESPILLALVTCSIGDRSLTSPACHRIERFDRRSNLIRWYRVTKRKIVDFTEEDAGWLHGCKL